MTISEPKSTFDNRSTVPPPSEGYQYPPPHAPAGQGTEPVPQPTYAPPPYNVPVSNTAYSQGSGPVPLHIRPRTIVPWSTGLFDCVSDAENCCITFWCPCITFGQVAEIIDQGSTSCGASGALYTLIAYVTGCQCMYSCFYRSKMRHQYSLEEHPCSDCAVHFFCEACALCQEYRELKNRGFIMQIGWHANMDKRNQEVAMAPTVEGAMSRY